LWAPLARVDAEATFDAPFFFAYLGTVSSTCRVSFTDGADVTHTVTVCLSLYEAAARGIAELKPSDFALASIGPATRLTISVEPLATTHELTVGKLQAWLDTNGKTLREQATKVTLRQLLGRVWATV
jgi:hypothetical protein